MAKNMDHLGQNFGEYRLLRKLGGGGFGTVYLGEHIRDQTLAAVKVLHARLTDPIDLKEFINEARTIRLKHPNIVSLLDFGIGDEDAPFLVMENAPHGTLRTRHPKGWQVPLSTVIEYANAIGSALQYAHNVNLVHRDVKPENMLIGADNQILLSDFGFATVAFNTHTSEGQNTVSGTIPYMAPEQFEGKAGAASDQYALAIVVYEWLSGSCPFKGTVSEVALQHSQTNPPSLCEKVPYLSREVERVVMTALAKDPKQRFASVQDFVEALEAVGQTTGRIAALPSGMSATNKLATKVLAVAEGAATGTMPTQRVVLKPQPVDAVAPGLAQSGSVAAVAVAQPLPPFVFSKKKVITVAGLALTLLVVAFLLMGFFTSGARAGVKSVSGLAVSTTIISTTTIPSTAVPPVVSSSGKTATPSAGKTAIPSKGRTVTPVPGKMATPSPGKTVGPQEPTVLPPTPTPIVLLPTPTPVAQPLPTPLPIVLPPTPTPTAQPLPTPTPTPTAVGSVRIDSGGSGSGLFVGDKYFSNFTPGRPSSTSNFTQSVIDTSGVSNPAPQSAYQSFRYGDCLYTIPSLTPNASYTVRLHFAEIYWTQAGKRTFNVTLNGQVVLSNFDIFATAGGENKAVVEQFVVQADSTGTITMQFKTVKDNAQINAIEVLAG